MLSKSGKPRTGNPEVSELDLAWLAGIIDGEGSICVYWDVRSQRRIPRIKISVANTDWLMIKRVRELFHALTGRHYKACEKFQEGATHRQWQIFLNRRASVIQILAAIFPYMVARRRQAWAAIEMSRLTWRRNGILPQGLFAHAEFIKNCNRTPTQPDDKFQFETVETGRQQIERLPCYSV